MYYELKIRMITFQKIFLTNDQLYVNKSVARIRLTMEQPIPGGNVTFCNISDVPIRFHTHIHVCMR